MTFDFPVEKIDIKFKTFGSCYLSFFINGIEIDVNGPVTILKDKIQDTNTINIEFLKAQPDDVHSYAELEYFKNLKETPCESQVDKKVPGTVNVFSNMLERIFQNRVNV